MRRTARELIAEVLDDFVSWDQPVDHAGFDAAYVDQLDAARERSGSDEAVLTGRGSIRGHEVAVIVGEFGFLGGSIGRETSRRIVDAVHRATRERLPLVATPSSGGTRMQEGTPAFVEMVTISRAVARHKAAGLPYLVYLRTPPPAASSRPGGRSVTSPWPNQARWSASWARWSTRRCTVSRSRRACRSRRTSSTRG